MEIGIDASKLAKGEYISILHDDDWLEKNFLDVVIRELKDECITVVPCIKDFRKEKSKNSYLKKLYLFLISNLYKIKKKRKYKLLDFFYSSRNHGTLGMVYKTSNLIKLGGFNENFYPSSDK